METISYLDFDLLIEGVPGAYRVRILASPTGQATGSFTAPLSPLELENFYLKVGRPREGMRSLNSPEMEAAKQVGGRLFEAVFTEQVYTTFRSSLDNARQGQKGLRLRLRVNAPELNDLPWEYLYNPRQNQFLSWSVNTPIVRFMESPHSLSALIVNPPLRILVVISSPDGYPPLNVEREWQQLQNALAPLERTGMVKLRRTDDASLNALQRYLRQKDVHILHFIGHGRFDTQSKEGLLLFEDENNQGRPISGEYLGTILADHNPLRLVVLNACEGARTSNSDPYSGVAQRLLQQGIPAVIAMQFPISDRASLTFGREFYTAVVDGFPVDAAISEARKAIFTQGSDVEWGTPVYFTHAPEGRIFNVERLPERNTSPVQQAAAPARQPIAAPAQQPPAAAPVAQAPAAPQVRARPIHRAPAPAYVPPQPRQQPAHQRANAAQPARLSGATGLVVGALIAALACLVLLLGGVIVYQQFIASTADTPSPTLPVDTPVSPVTSTMTATDTPSGLLAAITQQGAQMVLIPAGEFRMGAVDSDGSAYSEERPQHAVYLGDYYMDMYEVTNILYEACIQAGGCTSPLEGGSYTHDSYYGNPSYANYPVINVDWSQARAYCEWRGARLPTEAEWEKAARGGLEGKLFPWGDEVLDCSRANYGSCMGKAIGVGNYAPNGYGLYDMAGNVWEWIWDWYSDTYYQSQVSWNNPQGPSSGNERALRGGSWGSHVGSLHVAGRSSYDPTARSEYWGFRCSYTP